MKRRCLSHLPPPARSRRRCVTSGVRSVGRRRRWLGERACRNRWCQLWRRPRRATSHSEQPPRLLEAMGARLSIGVDRPYLASRDRQRDPAHAASAGYVCRRLIRAGWQVATEVEVGGDRSRGWIDVLAYHPGTRILLVIEIKTEIRDLGAIERTLGWYEREAWAAARRRGWRPRLVRGGLVLLATEDNDARLKENAASFRLGFPLRARDATGVVMDGLVPGRGRFLAMIDPASRRTSWLRPTPLDGRRTPAPYADYLGFLAAGCRHTSRSGRTSRPRA